MTRASIAANWIKKLKSKGISTYKFNDLPDELKSLSAHRKAITEELVEKISTKEMGGIWRVKWHMSKVKIKNNKS